MQKLIEDSSCCYCVADELLLFHGQFQQGEETKYQLSSGSTQHFPSNRSAQQLKQLLLKCACKTSCKWWYQCGGKQEHLFAMPFCTNWLLSFPQHLINLSLTFVNCFNNVNSIMPVYLPYPKSLH